MDHRCQVASGQTDRSVRLQYGDARLLREAMGHLFLEYEDADLASFVQLGIVNGWDLHLFPQLAYGEADTARIVISHDRWFCLHHKQEFALKQWRESLEKAQYELLR